MRIFRSASAAGQWAPGAVVAIGKFDGIHKGHKRLIRTGVRRARAMVTRCILLTFEPHPQEYFKPGSHRALTTRAEFLEEIGDMGVDGVVFLRFGEKMACQSPERFVQETLVRRLKALEVCVGANFCFGKDRAGRVATLVALGREYGFLVRSVPMARVAGKAVSSSRIRRLLAGGRRREAERCLGRSLTRK